MKKVAIITGSSRGIGRAIAVRLSRHGFAVVVNFVSDAGEAKKAVDEIRAAGNQAIAVQADVSKTMEVARLFDEAEHAFGGIDVLVNNAGVMSLKPIVETETELFERTFAINVRGTFNTLKQAAERLRWGGRIVNISSASVSLGMPMHAVYNASKAAVDAFTKTVANELRWKNITVNAVAPGPTETKRDCGREDSERIRQLPGLTPLEGMGTPEDVANVVAFLAGPDGGWINGQTIRSNGGLD
jgi:3-oxoacyl-[acyl-carrier protein] reductase